MNSPTRGWLEQILCSKRIPSKSKSILSTALTTAAKLALLFYSVNYTQLTSHLGPLFFRDNFMDRCVLACWYAALCWWSKKPTMKNQTAPLAEQRTDTFDSVDFIFILFHKVGSMRELWGKKTTAPRTEKNRRKRHGVFFLKPTRGGTFITGKILLLSNFNGNPNNV